MRELPHARFLGPAVARSAAKMFRAPVQPRQRRVSAPLAAVLSNAESSCCCPKQVFKKRPLCPAQKRRRGPNAPAPQHASSATASPQPHTRGQHRAANTPAQASAPPAKKGRAGPAGGHSSTDGAGSIKYRVTTVRACFFTRMGSFDRTGAALRRMRR